MKINKVSGRFSNDVCSVRAYKNALYNVLLELRPSVILEIGAYYGGTTRLIQDYLSEYCPTGRCISIDIKKYTDLSDCPNISSLIVHPYIPASSRWHDVVDSDILPCVEDSVAANIVIIRAELDRLGLDSFDMAWLDGDHSFPSVTADFIICNQLTKSPHYVLIDDVVNCGDGHNSVEYYNNLIETRPDLEFYNFSSSDGWDNVGMGLTHLKNDIEDDNLIYKFDQQGTTIINKDAVTKVDFT